MYGWKSWSARKPHAARVSWLAKRGPNPLVTCESSWRPTQVGDFLGLIASFFLAGIAHFCYG